MVALDRRALLRADRDQGSGAQRDQGRQGRLEARLSVSMRVRRQRQTMGFQAADHVGRRARGAGDCGLGSALDDRPNDTGGSRRARSLGPGGLTRYRRVSGDAVEYEVFARKTRGDPLHQVGSVVAPDDDLAAAYARATYDEERWIEMAIVRKDDVIELWQPGESSET